MVTIKEQTMKVISYLLFSMMFIAIGAMEKSNSIEIPKKTKSSPLSRLQFKEERRDDSPEKSGIISPRLIKKLSEIQEQESEKNTDEVLKSRRRAFEIASVAQKKRSDSLPSNNLASSPEKNKFYN